MRWDRLVLGLCALAALPTAVVPGTTLASVTYLAGSVLITAGLWWGSRRCVGRARRGWTLIAVTATCWIAGDTLQRILEALELVEDGAQPADAIWLASYLTLAGAVVVWLRGRGLSQGVLRDITVDTTVSTAVAVVVCWRLMIAPGLAEGTLDLDTVVGLLYPVGDVVVCSLALLLVLAPGRRGTPSALVITCLLATFAMDCFYAVQATVLPELDPERLDAGLLCVNALLATAALHPDRSELASSPRSDEAPRMHRWRVALLGGALITICTVTTLPSDAGTADHAMLTLAAAVASTGVVVRFYRVVREREDAQAALLERATHDLLTGLANRFLLLNRLEDAIRPAPGAPAEDVALLYLDLDGFKQINDTWGHAAGDEVLRTVAERLTVVVRGEDTVARMGGDEFVVLCPGLARDVVEHLAARLRATIEEEMAVSTDAGRTAVRVGASIGVVVRAAPSEPDPMLATAADELLRAADEAMYAAKTRGEGIRSVALGDPASMVVVPALPRQGAATAATTGGPFEDLMRT